MMNLPGNVTISKEGTTLVLKIDLSRNLGPSKSGKSTLVATTAGNVTLPDAGGATLGLNLYRK